MNRREMLSSAFRQLAQALPRLVAQGNLGLRMTGGLAAPPPPEALSFPRKMQESALPGPKPIKEDEVWP